MIGWHKIVERIKSSDGSLVVYCSDTEFCGSDVKIRQRKKAAIYYALVRSEIFVGTS